MFLHLLTEDSEKEFFLRFTYLLAVAEREDDPATIPIRSYSDAPEKGEYEFEEFAPGFSMQTSELLMLRKFAEEMEMKWKPVSSYHGNGLIGLPFLGIAMTSAAVAAVAGGIHGTCFPEKQTGKSPDALEKVARQNSVAEMLKTAMEEMGDTAERSAVLELVLKAIFAQTNAAVFATEKRKSILMEATAMAYADGTISENEQELLAHFCKLCGLDTELLEDFKDITQEFSTTYTKALELITE